MIHIIRQRILETISAIKPLDALEEKHRQEILEWIKSSAPLFRVQKPDIPNKHLVSYFVLLDEKASKVLLVDHKKALLWLPTGGHVEQDEDPKETVRRECLEELHIPADFWCEDPFFLTSTTTVGLTKGHTDVSLWYVLKGDCSASYIFDHDEFNSIQWFAFEDIPYEKSDPHMKRFMEKLRKKINDQRFINDNVQELHKG
jgi:8-oxo-dGTP diphosphatase